MRSSLVEMPVDAAGDRRRIGGEPFDEIDHLGALRGRKPDEGFQKPQALDRFAGWIAELLAQFRGKCAIGHLTLFSGSTQARPVEIMPRNNPTGKANSAHRLRKGARRAARPSATWLGFEPKPEIHSAPARDQGSFTF